MLKGLVQGYNFKYTVVDCYSFAAVADVLLVMFFVVVVVLVSRPPSRLSFSYSFFFHSHSGF